MRILLTSFTTWMEHQRSNASDDLIQAILERDRFHSDCHLLRQLPVDFELAPKHTIAKINEIQPDITICCGMAELRQRLSLESNGKFQSEILRSRLDLQNLIESTSVTEISHDAGNFVCNYLYYRVLKHLDTLNQQCVFIHVPILTATNEEVIVQDFLRILDRVSVNNP
ncbi:MAG: peptidase C15 [Plectolyngbya sp. WJT66-NPBG17]|nr:peptidase C15 [Plectolyngbya sp. WJT66-NPBG17]